MSPIKRPDPQRKGKVEGCFVRGKHEVLCRDSPESQVPAADTSKATAFRQGDRSCRTVDAKDEAGVADPLKNGPCGNTRATANLKYPHPSANGQGCHGLCNTLRNFSHRT